MMESCTSCNKEVREDYTAFKCPACGKAKILRCNRCKSISKLYKCPECGFVGP
ncbi:MAG: zinc finger domain-containing protein [archaeon]